MANLNAWAQTVVGRYIDVDQWAGNQCWDLSQAWLTACNGGTLWTQPSRFPGLAAGSWEVATQNTANTDDLLRHVTPIPGTERGQPGDLIIWAYGSPDYPISHTAVLMEDRGPILRTISQNSSPPRPDLPGYSVKSSGPTIYQDLTRAGILGFLRPRATITGQSAGIEPIQEDDMTAQFEQDVRGSLQGITDFTNDARGAIQGITNQVSGLQSFMVDVRGDLANKGAQNAALTSAVQVLATSQGLDPAAVMRAVEKAAQDGVAGALSNLTASVEIKAAQ